MKKKQVGKYAILLLTAALVLLSISLGGCYWASDGENLGGIASNQNIYVSNQQQGIWVSGSGSVWVTPDITNLRLGIVAQTDTVAEAQEDAAVAMNDVLDVLGEQGIDEDDIQTTRFSIQQLTRWDSVKDEQVVTGYQVTNIVSVKIREVESTGTVIDAVAQAGGDLTRVDSISFSVDEPEDYYDEARELAMEDATDKAKQLADLADVKLGTPLYVTESNPYTPYVQYDSYVRAPAAEGVTTSISPGELEITVDVQVAYEIVD